VPVLPPVLPPVPPEPVVPLPELPPLPVVLLEPPLPAGLPTPSSEAEQPIMIAKRQDERAMRRDMVQPPRKRRLARHAYEQPFINLIERSINDHPGRRRIFSPACRGLRH
jgi:hypothetical protein